MPATADKPTSILSTTNGANGHAPSSLAPSRDELIEQLYREPGKAEIVGGKIIHFMPTGDEPSSTSFEIASALRTWARATGAAGRAYADSTGFLVNLPNRFLDLARRFLLYRRARGSEVTAYPARFRRRGAFGGRLRRGNGGGDAAEARRLFRGGYGGRVGR